MDKTLVPSQREGSLHLQSQWGMFFDEYFLMYSWITVTFCCILKTHSKTIGVQNVIRFRLLIAKHFFHFSLFTIFSTYHSQFTIFTAYHSLFSSSIIHNFNYFFFHFFFTVFSPISIVSLLILPGYRSYTEFTITRLWSQTIQPGKPDKSLKIIQLIGPLLL